MDANFKGAARRLDDLDLPKLGARIGVGEDEIHAFLDVEPAGMASTPRAGRSSCSSHMFFIAIWRARRGQRR
ncbi:hypothetical protein [Mesorhizobium ventifaucium]|uniref:DUF1127 domain-containing protein n=1 Tax=Mesorhizobium ventifaucium TaxID=666020 RepID=A0ABM9EDR1_9HYPH|nr:hypothetical protein [Mesorhizobium ventifaucium]CAH2407467.1 hypothetical protein MES4922_670003 [Mesorhizobium ventifaucium]